MDWATIKQARWFRWLRELMLLTVVFGGVMIYQSRNHLSSGSSTPTFDLQVLDGAGSVASASLMGKPTVLYFWAPWCGVCEASSHNMAAVNEAVSDEYNVLSVALEYRSLDAVREFAKRNDVTYPVLLGNRSVSDQFSVSAFPTIYVLDDEGRVSSSVVGYTTEIGIRARLWWAGL